MKITRVVLFAVAFSVQAGVGVAQGEKLGAKQEQKQERFAGFQVEEDIVYKRVQGRELKLVLFLPENKSEEPMPWMLYTHGGGWRGGSVDKILKPVFVGTLRKMLDDGIACAAVAYRRTLGDITAIEAVQDCKDAGRFLVQNAGKWNLDPERSGVWGGSAGGHLSLMTALGDHEIFEGATELAGIEPRYRCVVSYYPLTSFSRRDLFIGSNFEDPETFVPMLGGTAENKPEVAKILSPVEYVGESMPPVLLIHGERDRILPISQSELFFEAAREFAGKVSLMRVRGAGHSLSGESISPSVDEVNQKAFDFINRKLRGE